MEWYMVRDKLVCLCWGFSCPDYSFAILLHHPRKGFGKSGLIIMMMRMMKKNFFLTLLLVFSSAGLAAQQAVVCCGGFISEGESEFSYSVGQAVVVYACDESFFLLGGVQQPYLAEGASNEAIESGESDFRIRVYPNPVREEVLVECPSASRTRPCILKIMDNLGRLQGDFKLDVPKKSLDMTRFPSGMYVFLFLDGEGRILQYEKVLKAGE